jgi:4-amino-4-deoxy-L-arabinose transferase-like glycosyltransferase
MDSRSVVILLALGGVLCLVGLGNSDLYRNEGLRALGGAEILRTGSWAVPTLHGEPRLTKPPGMTWAIALCSWPLGRVTPETARLPSVIAGLSLVLLFGWSFARVLGRGAGLVAGCIVPCSMLWLDRVPSAEIDLVQAAWVSASLLFLLRAVEAEEEAVPRWSAWVWWQAGLVCMAGGLLTKWTGPAFFYLTALVFLAGRRRLHLLLGCPHLLALTLVALPCLGWIWLAGRTAGWDTLVDTVGREALQRLSPSHHPRPYPWGELITFPLGFLLACLPWSALVGLQIADCRLQIVPSPGPEGGLPPPGLPTNLQSAICNLQSEKRLLLLLHAWLWPNLLFWTLVPGHRPRHILPLQPALAGLAALVWWAWSSGRLRWPIPRLRPGTVLAGLVLTSVIVKLLFAFAWAPARTAGQQARMQGEEVACQVQPGTTLHLCRLKDEGLLFYAGLPTRRVASLDEVPAGGWVLLTEGEWPRAADRAGFLHWLHDEQGAPIVLVRLRVKS